MYTSYFIALKFKYNTKAKLKQYGPNLNIRMVNTIKRTMTFWAGTRNYSEVDHTFSDFMHITAAAFELKNKLRIFCKSVWKI